MPAWVLSWLLPLALHIVAVYGIPELERRFPKLAPLLEEILKAMGGLPVNPAVHTAAEVYKKECEGVACPSDVKST